MMLFNFLGDGYFGDKVSLDTLRRISTSSGFWHRVLRSTAIMTTDKSTRQWRLPLPVGC